MKNWFLLAALLLSSVGSADPENVSTLSTKIIMEDTSGYFVLSDGSLWKTIAFSKRSRSLSEWWNGVELAPKNFECLPSDWYLGSEIEIVSKRDSHVNEANAGNQEMLTKCTHLLVNTKTEQILFAVKMEFGECLAQVHKEALAQGYSSGYHNGYRTGYNAGYSAGRSAPR